MDKPHDCWWSRHRASEIYICEGHVQLSGICGFGTLQYLASILGEELVMEEEEDEQRNRAVHLGAGQEAWLHDECFLSLPAASARMTQAAMASMIEMHRRYLGVEAFPDSVTSHLTEFATKSKGVRLCSDIKRGRLLMRSGEGGLFRPKWEVVHPRQS